MFITVLNEHRQPAAIRAAYIWRIEQDHQSKKTYIRCINTDTYTITEESFDTVLNKVISALVFERQKDVPTKVLKGGDDR